MGTPLRIAESPPPRTRSLKAWGVSVWLHGLVAIVLCLIIRNVNVPKPIQLQLSLESGVPIETDTVVSVVRSEKVPVESVSPPLPVPVPETSLETVTPEPISVASPKQEQSEQHNSASFFGTDAIGEKFIYILDNSYSMKARKNDRYRRACDELLRSVSQLTANQSYSVFLFNWETAVMYHASAPRYRAATGDHVDELRSWITSASLGPGTDPRRALSLASQMHPDAAYFLSDGDFNEPPIPSDANGWLDAQGALAQMTMQEGIHRMFADKQIPIHTFAFENPFTMDRLRQIAGDTGGSFRYVKTEVLRPTDATRYQEIVAKIAKDPNDAALRVRMAKALLEDGELLYAESVLRPVRGDQLDGEFYERTFQLMREIFASELGETRLEDFADQ